MAAASVLAEVRLSFWTCRLFYLLRHLESPWSLLQMTAHKAVDPPSITRARSRHCAHHPHPCGHVE